MYVVCNGNDGLSPESASGPHLYPFIPSVRYAPYSGARSPTTSEADLQVPVQNLIIFIPYNSHNATLDHAYAHSYNEWYRLSYHTRSKQQSMKRSVATETTGD